MGSLLEGLRKSARCCHSLLSCPECRAGCAHTRCLLLSHLALQHPLACEPEQEGEKVSLPFCTFGRSPHWVRSYKALPMCNSELLCKLQLMDGLLLQLWLSQAGILPG